MRASRIINCASEEALALIKRGEQVNASGPEITRARVLVTRDNIVLLEKR
ncbi:MAG TPA: hypothetical protein VGO91_05940 [Pyrinomonadaceae bacterium]|jgi:hypothetical protein|nr:hypothetical protein [Pyrinomonadaceae bacterium]